MAVRGVQVLLAGLVVCLLMVTVYCCSPPPRGWEEPSLVERVYHSDTVFLGRIVEKRRDDRLSMAGDDAFIGKTEVYCILKGPEQQRFVNVTHLGIVHARCTRVDVDEGGEYIIFGYSMDGVVHHSDMRSVPASEENVAEVSRACDLDIQYPEGVDRTNAPIACPRTAGPDECVPDEHNQAAGLEDHDDDDMDHGHDHDDDGDHDHDDHDHDHGHPDDGHADHDHDGDGDHDHHDHHHHGHEHEHDDETTGDPNAAASRDGGSGGVAVLRGAAPWLTGLLYLAAILLVIA